jgi:hypothetical protein
MTPHPVCAPRLTLAYDSARLALKLHVPVIRDDGEAAAMTVPISDACALAMLAILSQHVAGRIVRQNADLCALSQGDMS